jgi:CHAT domain-containing protein
LSIDEHVFLQQLRDLSLEEGEVYIQQHWTEVGDCEVVGGLIRHEARREENKNALITLKLGELLIFFGDLVQHEQWRAQGLMAKGDALRLMGQHKAALEYLDRAGEELWRLGDEIAWAHSRVSWMVCATWLGRADEALREAERAREVFLSHNNQYWACAVEHNQALLYRQLGRYQEASAIYERLLAVLPSITDEKAEIIQRAIAMANANLALILVLQGKFERARVLLLRASQGFEVLGYISAIVKIEVHLAEIDYVQGYYGSALRQYYLARDHMLEQKIVDGPMSLAALHLRIADCLVKLNRAHEAYKLVEEAVESYRQVGVPLDIGEGLRAYASTLVALGRPGEALKALDEAQELFESGSLEHYALATRLQRAELLLVSGASDTAYEQASRVKPFFEARDLLVSAIHAGLIMAEALIVRETEARQRSSEIANGQASEWIDGREEERLEEARRLCLEATERARRHNVQEEVYRGYYLLGKLALLGGNELRATRHYRIAIGQIERILDDLVHDLSPAFLRTAWSVYEDMIALCLQQGEAELAFGYLERARSVVLRRYLDKSRKMLNREDGEGRAEAERLASSTAVLQVQRELEEWQQSYRKYSVQLANYDMFASPSIDLTVIQEELKRCEGKLSELFERLQLSELEVRSNTRGRRAHRHPSNVQQMDEEYLRQQLAPGQLLLAYFLFQGKLVIFAATREGLKTYEKADVASQIERYLPLLHAHLQPGGWPDQLHPPQQVIRRLLNKLYTLLIAPVAEMLPPSGGHLTIVPYGSLHTLPFHALYNGTRFLIEDFLISYLPASSVLLQLEASEREVIDASDRRPPLIFGYSGNGQLPRAIEEARILKELLGGRCYLEEEATIERLLQEARGSSIIHLATHGRSRLDAPNFSSVQLADGQLNALDAFSLDLQGCELETLSGCETGLSLSGGGDEQLGLGRAFLAAGVSSLVMSLWPVEDVATSILMQHFYERLLAGDSKVEALCTAQRHLLARTSELYAHPYFWAAFRLVGSVGPLRLNSLIRQAIPQKIDV